MIIKLWSEFEPCDDTDYSETLTYEELGKYHEDQVATNGFEGNINTFIEEYGLQFEIWMLKQEFDLTGVTTILINISW